MPTNYLIDKLYLQISLSRRFGRDRRNDGFSDLTETSCQSGEWLVQLRLDTLPPLCADFKGRCKKSYGRKDKSMSVEKPATIHNPLPS